MEPEASLPCSQQLATGPYPEPAESTSHFPIPVRLTSIQVLSSHLHLSLLRGLFLTNFLTKILYAFLTSPYVLHAPHISFPLIWST